MVLVRLPIIYLYLLWLQIDTKEQIQSYKQQNEDKQKDLNQPNIEAIREDIMQREKNIWQQEQEIQNVVFQRIYARRMNKKVRKRSSVIEMLSHFTDILTAVIYKYQLKNYPTLWMMSFYLVHSEELLLKFIFESNQTFKYCFNLNQMKF